VERLVETLARALVQDADAVRVNRFNRGDSLVVELDVSPADRGRLIGRSGQTISALRTLLTAVAERRGQRCELEIRE
jgi:predicted RNA-binding protein YlqC (UPF0109 family)